LPVTDTTRGNAGKSTKRAKRVARRAAPKPYSPPTTGDTPYTDAERKKVKRFKKKSPVYKKAIEAGYDANDAAGKKKILENAKGPERKIVRKLHKRRDRNAAQSGRGDRNTQPSLDRVFGRGDIRSDADYHRGDEVKASDEYLRTRRMARKVRYDRADDAEKKRIFGTPREDVKKPGVLSRFKAEDDRVTEINRKRLRKSVEAELSGQGKLAKGLNSLAELASKPLGKKGKDGKGGSSFATIFASNAVPGLSIAPKKVKKIGENTVKDAINFPAQIVPSAYVPTAAAIEAASGNPERLKKYLKDIDENDPLFNVAQAAYKAATGDSKGAKKAIGEAGKAASEHPGLTALEVVGAKGTLGRGGGKVMRSGVVGKKAKRAASTTRAVQTLEGTKVVRKREYSPDVIKKGRQVAVEKVARRSRDKLIAKADKEKSPEVKADLQRRAARKDPDRVTSHEIKRRVDERVDANETVRRSHRAKAVNEAQDAVGKAKKQGPLVNLVAQGIVRADVDDIRAYVRELESEFDGLSKAGKRANKQLRHDIEKALSSKKLDLGQVREAAKAYADRARPLEDNLVTHGLLDREQADMARLMPYAVRRMGAKHDGDRLVGPDGDTLHADVIREHMTEHHDGPDPSFLSQAPNSRGGRNFFVSSARAPSAGVHRRTGEGTRGGTYDAHPDTMTEQAARAQGLVDAHEGFGGFLDEFAYRKRGAKGKATQYTKKSLAEKAARDMNLDAEGNALPNAVEWVPVRANPFGGSKAQLDHLMDDVNTSSDSIGSHDTVVDTLLDALGEHRRKGDSEGEWILVPKVAAERQAEHLRVLKPGAAGKALQAGNSAFRRTVLSTSLPWMLGNISEGTLRTALAKAGPMSYLTGRKVVKRLQKDGNDEAIARMLPGGHFNAAEKQRIHQDVSRYVDTRLESTARVLGAVRRTPGPKQVADAWHHYTDFVFRTVNGRLEGQFQTAMLGKELRRSGLMDGDMLKLSKTAVDQAVKGLTDTNEQVAFGRAIDRMYGRYGKYSPDMRKAIALYTPFVAWTLNAYRFMFQVLPQDHPLLLTLLAQAEFATEDWRKSHGLDKFMKDRVPRWMQGSIPAPDGGKFRGPMRYTPFGAFGDPLGTTAGALLPQVSGIQDAFEGRSWTGQELKASDGGEPTELDMGKAAGLSFLGGSIPFLTLGQTLKRKGPKKYVTDSVTGRIAPKQKTAKKGAGLSWGDESSGGVKWSDEKSGGVKWPD